MPLRPSRRRRHLRPTNCRLDQRPPPNLRARPRRRRQAMPGKNLFFSTDVEKNVAESDIIFVSVNTPTKTRGLGAGKAPDLTYWESAARMIAVADVSRSDKIVVEKSTVPVKTAEAIERILMHNSKGINYQILSNPEFLAEV